MGDRHAARGVVVGFDGSPKSEKAVLWAAVEARRRAVPLTLCHAWEVYMSAGPMAFPDTDLKLAAEQLLEHGVERAREEWDNVESVLGRGSASSVLMDAAADAELVVVGSRSHNKFGNLVLGSAAVEMTAHSPCPVVVVREEKQTHERVESGNVVVGVDGSEASREAVGVGFTEAHLHKTSLVVLLAWPRSVESGVLPLLNADDLRGLAQDRLARLIAPWRDEYPEVKVDARVEIGPPREVLLEASADAGLLVVGSRGLGGFRGLLLGSVSRALLDQAPCPVAVAHAPEPSGG
jgi:nucleotide-binding universal stress UspA family protein